jgi:hypothetical protein
MARGDFSAVSLLPLLQFGWGKELVVMTRPGSEMDKVQSLSSVVTAFAARQRDSRIVQDCFGF